MQIPTELIGALRSVAEENRRLVATSRTLLEQSREALEALERARAWDRIAFGDGSPQNR